ncbi:MAG: Crp/Fnr family transcriptional regulator [Bacteroidales bacterium]|jgi:CRP-like cAMP-binding protein|nr:Crp/Fnr family transcriptional regulator [Bacteroidales bacterium]
MEINNIIQKIYELPENSYNLLCKHFSQVYLPKGHILFESDRIIKEFFFLAQGIVRAFYHDNNGNEITFWFGYEGDPVLSMQSYINNSPGYETIELLENCIFFKIRTEDLYSLYMKDLNIANWGRKLAENELLKTEENFISRQFKTASERYNELMKNNPELFQRVQLGHIASYLGITQVSLSRIRANNKI